MGEGEQIVAWLREMATGFVDLHERKGADAEDFGRMGEFIYNGAADAIERGDHAPSSGGKESDDA